MNGGLTSHREWTESLEAGDDVIVPERLSRHRLQSYEIHQVEKVTKTQIVVDNGRRYRRAPLKYPEDEGREIGGNFYGTPVIFPATPENLAIVEVANAKAKAQDRRRRMEVAIETFRNWDKMGDAELKMVYNQVMSIREQAS